MKKSIVLSLFLILAVSNAWAFGGGCGMGPGFGMGMYSAAGLNLTADQKAKIEAKQEAFQDQINPLRDQLVSKRMELKDLWAKAAPDQAQIIAKQKEIQDIQSQIQEKATEFRLECRQLLTPEQQEKYASTIAQKGGCGGGHRNRQGW